MSLQKRNSSKRTTLCFILLKETHYACVLCSWEGCLDLATILTSLNIYECTLVAATQRSIELVKMVTISESALQLKTNRWCSFQTENTAGLAGTRGEESTHRLNSS